MSERPITLSIRGVDHVFMGTECEKCEGTGKVLIDEIRRYLSIDLTSDERRQTEVTEVNRIGDVCPYCMGRGVRLNVGNSRIEDGEAKS